jgi:DNA (cytosine-5)-methyltransferase 1
LALWGTQAVSTPRLLDLFCGAGGCARGYQMAGFHVTGVDIKPQPRYAGDVFIQGDALDYCRDHGHQFDVIHASPPCQAFTALKTMPNAKQHDDLLTPTRDLLIALGKPYVIENVPGAPMRNPIVLCGSMFRLGCDDAELRRHRLFETWPIWPLTPPCDHYWKQRVIGVYGGHGRDLRRVRPDTVRDGVQQFSTDERRKAMGIEWMTGDELSQAIPPAYCEFIGSQLMQEIDRG